MFHLSSSPVLITLHWDNSRLLENWRWNDGNSPIHELLGDEVGDEPVVLADTQAPVGNFDTRKFRV